MIIKNQEELIYVCNNFRRCEFVTVDTEFLREKTYFPKLCLVQIAAPGQKAVAIDPIEGNLNLTPLFDLLKDESVLKVFHAARQDLEIFYNLMGSVPAPLFDTQIAAMVCGMGDSVGYETLIRNTSGAEINKSMQYTDWSRRPLSDAQIDYALSDVTHLIDAYLALKEQLERENRSTWMKEEAQTLTDPSTLLPPPEDSWQRIKIKSARPKNLIILKELASWRETLAQKRNIPRNWVMKDETLADIATQCPVEDEDLERIRNIPKDDGSLYKALLSIVKKAQKIDRKKWPKQAKRLSVTPEHQALIDLLKLLLKTVAAHNNVSPRLIASSDDIKMLVLGEETPETKRILKGWRSNIFGQHIERLKNGEISIGYKDGQVSIIEQT